MKKTWKKAAQIITVSVIGFSMVACSGTSASLPENNEKSEEIVGAEAEGQSKSVDDIIEVKIATVVAESSPLHQSMMKFIEEVEKEIPGRVEFKVYPNSQMGNERDIAEGILLGTVQGGVLSDGVISMVDPLGMAEMGNVPFLIKSRERYYEMLDEFYGEIVNDEYKNRGFINFAYYLAGGVDVGNTKRPVRTPDDLKGLKIRTWEAEGPYKFLETCGSIAVPMAFGEVYTGLQQSAIDGVITSDFQFNTQKFTEICKYITSFHVFYNYQTLTFGQDWFESLPEDIQQAFIKAGEASHAYCRDVVSPAFAESTYADMEAAGVEVVYLTDSEKEVFAEKVADTWPEFRERIGAEIFDRVVEYMREE